MECDIDEVLEWAKKNGIECNGIRPQYVEGRGIGIFAARRIAAGEVILKVPARMLRTVANTPKHIVSSLPGASTHAILAASLCLDGSQDLQTWSRLFPSREDVRAVMPICWAARHQELLPEGARDILKAQQAKFAADWAPFGRRFPWIARREYLYHWLLVNTRTFYYKSGGGGGGGSSGKRTGKPGEDMALQPVADLFNHLPGDHCAAAFAPAEGFRFTANRDYAAGEELYVRYGAHGNDTLLVEYGFSLPGELNAWDEVALLEFLRPLFGRDRRRLLEQAGFWGRYALDRSAACYRTQIALRLLVIPQEAWLDVVAGERDEDRDSDVVDERWRVELRKIRGQVRWMSSRVDGCKDAAPADGDDADDDEHEDADADHENSATAVPQLRQRWAQILRLVELELERLGAADDSEDDDDDAGEQADDGHSEPPAQHAQKPPVPEAKNPGKSFDAEVLSAHEKDDDNNNNNKEEERGKEGRPVLARVP